jgi:hypothetical protein
MADKLQKCCNCAWHEVNDDTQENYCRQSNPWQQLTEDAFACPNFHSLVYIENTQLQRECAAAVVGHMVLDFVNTQPRYKQNKNAHYIWLEGALTGLICNEERIIEQISEHYRKAIDKFEKMKGMKKNAK